MTRTAKATRIDLGERPRSVQELTEIKRNIERQIIEIECEGLTPYEKAVKGYYSGMVTADYKNDRDLHNKQLAESNERFDADCELYAVSRGVPTQYIRRLRMYAYEVGHSSGNSEIASIFQDIVSQIFEGAKQP